MSSRQERRALERKNAKIQAIKDREKKYKENLKQNKIKEKSENIKTNNKISSKNGTKQIGNVTYFLKNHWKKVVVGLIAVIFVIGAVVSLTLVPKQGKYGQIIAGNPTLIDIGSTSCVPCQQLQPVLVSLGTKYDGQINIEFYDCWNTTEGADMATRYNATTIPTLIFLDGNGNVVARMTGYNEQSVIEAKFRSLGWI